MESTSALPDIDRFRRWMTAERKSKHTVKQYSFFAEMFLRICKKPLDEITDTDLEDFKEYLAIEKGYSKSSQYTCIKAVQLYYRSNGITPPTALTTPKRGRKVPVYLTEEEMSRLLEAASPNSRNLAIVNVLAYTGIRLSELCSLNTGDLDLQEGTLFVRSGKGDKDRMVMMSDSCILSVKNYLKTRSHSPKSSNSLFLSRVNMRIDPSTVQRMIRKLSETANIEKHVTPHVLRHTFATTILRNGGDIRFIQKLLGHSSVATTEVYTHIDDGTMKKMYSKYKPSY